MISTRKKQSGYSFFTVGLIILIGGIFFSVGFKIYPPYLDFHTMDKVLTDIINNPEELKKPTRSLKRDLDKKWAVNQIRLPSKDSLIIRRKEGWVIMTLKYESRVPMFYNVDAMVKFDKEYKAKLP